MRDSIAADIRGGKSGQQVIDAYVAQYGEKIRISPSASGFNLVAWLGPGLALLVGGAMIALLVRRWRHRSIAVEAAPAPLLPSDDPYVARLEREIRDSQ
jgi:cytochrome c-type biogenesis protein CcmH